MADESARASHKSTAARAAAKLVSAGLGIALLIGCGNQPNTTQPTGDVPDSGSKRKQSGPRPSGNRPPKEPEKVEPGRAIRVSAEDLDDAFEDNVDAANAKYKDKVIEVTGTVHKIDRSDSSAVTVELRSGEKDDDTIDCDFLPANAGEVAALKKGESVVIRGTCVGRVKGTVTLERCSLVK
jgi:hypothetical protein